MNKQKTPVVFFHIGNQKYLKTAIDMAEKNNNVVLIGDKSNRNYCKNWTDYENYQSIEYRKFANSYQHMSSNSKEFELSCFQRYFFLYEFMKTEKLEFSVMADSDLLIFCDLNEYFEKYRCPCALSISHNGVVSAHCSYWTVESLADFIGYLEKMYTDDIEKLKAMYARMRAKKELGGICDMTALKLWSKTWTNILNLGVMRDDMVFDHCLQTDSDFESNKFCFSRILRMKKIYYINNMPCFQMIGGGMVHAATIHCQGSCKAIMPYATKKINFWLILVVRYVELAKRVRARIKRRIELLKE